MKNELVAIIYEKALKRKDVTGIVYRDSPSKGKGKGKDDGGKKKKDGGSGAQDPSSADIGKIVSLVATDADRAVRFVSFAQVC